MSFAEKRAAFRTALNAVDGVTGYVDKPSVPAAGDAWPVWGGAGRDEPGLPFTHLWRVVVALPADEATAEEWLEDHLGPLHAALSPVAYVEGFAVSNLSPTIDQRFGLVITTRSE